MLISVPGRHDLGDTVEDVTGGNVIAEDAVPSPARRSSRRWCLDQLLPLVSRSGEAVARAFDTAAVARWRKELC